MKKMGSPDAPTGSPRNIRTRLMFLVLLATLLPAALIGLRFIQDRAENVEIAKHHL